MKHLKDIVQESLFDKDIIEKDPVKLNPANLHDCKEVALYANMKWPGFAEVESSWGVDPRYKHKAGPYAFRIKYNKHLSLVVDFVNDHNFIYTWEEDGKEFYSLDSIMDIQYVGNWDWILDPKEFVRMKNQILSRPKVREKLPHLAACVEKIKNLY